MSTPPKPNQPASTGGPSIRLNIGQKASNPPPKTASPPPPAKKPRFTAPASVRPNTAHSSTLRLLHQKSNLSFCLARSSPTSEPSWYAQGTTSLYVLDENPSSTPTTPGAASSPAANTPSILQLALHLRGTCQVSSVTVESINKKDLSSLHKLSCSYQHLDPLEKVLLKPAVSYAVDEPTRHEADAQSSRGAIGMTNATRAASTASNMGELRISAVYQQTPKEQQEQQVDTIRDCWKKDLSQPLSNVGHAISRLSKQLEPRVEKPKASRIQWVSQTLSRPSVQQRALKITIQYQMVLGKHVHFGGIHAVTSNRTPHIYTTSGTYGDHEGPRSWIPTLDTASTKHRASQELSIQVSAPMKEGLSIVGMGEDYGMLESLLHEFVDADPQGAIAQELGKEHVAMMQRISSTKETAENAPHVIPPESESNQVTSIDSVLVTSVWTSSSWLPIPARSLGFAIGPFRVLEDPEYFSPVADDDQSEEANETRQALQSAREHGEGIRQVYFAPIFARKHIHANANTKLIPDTSFQFTPLTRRQVELIEGLDQSVLTATIGVPHRALSLARDILALPAFRSVSYTQIWIPNAVHGGSTSGALHCCPEVLNNPFLGGAIMDARLLPPVGHRLPYHQGGRVLQFLQARCAIRGWVIAAIPLGGRDDVGQGYIHSLIESLLVSLYERGHGAHGEGGGKGGVFFTKRFATGSGLNSSNLDFLPVQNIEDTELDVVTGGVVGAVPVEDRNNDQLWRSATNGTESHTSAMDEFAIRLMLCKDAVDALERGTDKDRFVPTPSMGWLGSHLSLSFLSSNATSSSDLGCGALDLVHPTGGLPYRSLKSDLLRRVVEGRAGIANFIRLVRAAFIAAYLDDTGKTELKYPQERKKAKAPEKDKTDAEKAADKDIPEGPKPRFIVCVNELLKKKGLTHTLFTRALQNLAGRIREAQLLGTLVDIERESRDPRTQRPFVEPEAFPNSYVRGASELYLRVGVHVEPSREAAGSQGAGVTKGIQMQAYAEPVIPEGGIAYGGPVTIRVVENEGQFREFVKDLTVDGSRRDWGSLFLHAKPVTLPKAQTDASGIIESTASKDSSKNAGDKDRDGAPTKRLLGASSGGRGAFDESALHNGGYQAIELIRLTNLTPLLWVRVDPMGLYGGRISVFQPDACLAEQLFHDGDAGAQVDALRSLAERPLRIQGSVKVTSVYDVAVTELPVRVLGDCLRGSPALHSSLPHTPAVRVQAAYCIAQWQNNKAPSNKNTVSANHWVGINLLIQYFRERFYNNGIVMPVKFNRVVLKKNGVEASQNAAAPEGASGNPKSEEDAFHYLDSFDEGAERVAVLEEVDEVEVEEDEEYRVRSAVITSIASIRAKDGFTPAAAVEFLETILDAVDAEMIGNLVSPDEEVMLGKKRRQMKAGKLGNGDELPDDDLNDGLVPSLPYISSMLLADALLALCHVNASPSLITDPATGKPVQSKASHPVTKLMEISRRWLEWELYREGTRAEIEAESLTGVSGVCYDTIAASAITALSSLAILRQSTTDPSPEPEPKAEGSEEEAETPTPANNRRNKLDEAATASFYINIFDTKPRRSDVTRAACAQAIACICCATDRFESESVKPVGLLTSLEFILERIVDNTTTPGLRQTLAQLMIDACTGKICSMQRVGAIGGRNELITSAARFLNGSLGASHGGDNGSAAVTSVSETAYPAASAVNDGARRGLRLLSRAGHPRETGIGEKLVVRIARFATNLWRAINGEAVELSDNIPGHFNGTIGVCANDGHLRCTMLALWQWLWPRGCFAVMQVQTWKSHEGTKHYREIGAHHVMKTLEEEVDAANAEEASLAELNRLVEVEIDRQLWRGEMAMKAYEYYKTGKVNLTQDASALEQGIGQPLPPIQRDSAFKAGGWIASSAQQRRALALDGGTAVTKLRLRKSGD